MKWYEAKDWCIKVYNYLNGRINKIKAFDIVFVNDRDKCYAYKGFGVICIELDQFFEVMRNKFVGKEIDLNNGVYDAQLRGALVCIIGHELSHFDQDYYPTKLYISKEARKDRKEEIRKYELSNHLRTVKFIYNNYDELYNNIGIFDINGVMLIDATTACIEEDHINPYISIKNEEEVFFKYLDFLVFKFTENSKQMVYNSNADIEFQLSYFPSRKFIRSDLIAKHNPSNNALLFDFYTAYKYFDIYNYQTTTPVDIDMYTNQYNRNVLVFEFFLDTDFKRDVVYFAH